MGSKKNSVPGAEKEIISAKDFQYYKPVDLYFTHRANQIIDSQHNMLSNSDIQDYIEGKLYSILEMRYGEGYHPYLVEVMLWQVLGEEGVAERVGHNYLSADKKISVKEYKKDEKYDEYSQGLEGTTIDYEDVGGNLSSNFVIQSCKEEFSDGETIEAFVERYKHAGNLLLEGYISDFGDVSEEVGGTASVSVHHGKDGYVWKPFILACMTLWKSSTMFDLERTINQLEYIKEDIRRRQDDRMSNYMMVEFHEGAGNGINLHFWGLMYDIAGICKDQILEEYLDIPKTDDKTVNLFYRHLTRSLSAKDEDHRSEAFDSFQQIYHTIYNKENKEENLNDEFSGEEKR